MIRLLILVARRRKQHPARVCRNFQQFGSR